MPSAWFSSVSLALVSVRGGGSSLRRRSGQGLKELPNPFRPALGRRSPGLHTGDRGVSTVLQMVGLLGAYSNPEIQRRLRQLSEKLDRLAASNAAPRHSGRQDRRLRGGLVPKAIEQVLHEAIGPMRARDIHAEVEELLGRSVPASSVKNWLAKRAHGDHPRVVRLGRGRYRLAVS